MFLTEGETDCLRLWQELSDAGTEEFAVYGIPGVNGWHGSYALLDSLSSAERVYLILDEESDYNKQSYVDKCWRQIRADLGGKLKRIRLPQDPVPTKDLCEFFQSYSLETLRLMADAPTVSGRFKPLNLRVPAPPVDWFLDQFLAAGDLAVVQGDPGLGKSMLCMDLAVAVAQGREEWLGIPLLKHGRVLYVDEENPESLIRDRLDRLGLEPLSEATNNVRYLHRQAVRFDKNPYELVEEALDYDPVLIILDSLTRFHTQDENNAGAISRLFDEGVLPLSREVGATVILIHHVTKTDSNSGFRRSRGSGDIVANIDTGLDCRGSDVSDIFVLHQYKSRRGKGYEDIRVKIQDIEDGKLKVVRKDLPF